MVLTSAEKSARYRAKDIEAYRAKKNALNKLPHHQKVRAEYARRWREAHWRPRKPRARTRTDEQIKERKLLSAAKWRNANRDRHNATSNRAYHKNKHKYKAKIRDYWLRKNYGISSIEFDQLFIKQGSKCAICGSVTARSKRTWHVDHCHQTGAVRGILCFICNTKLGWYERFNAAIKSYLEV